jgi:hypothetical protein
VYSLINQIFYFFFLIRRDPYIFPLLYSAVVYEYEKSICNFFFSSTFAKNRKKASDICVYCAFASLHQKYTHHRKRLLYNTHHNILVYGRREVLRFSRSFYFFIFITRTVETPVGYITRLRYCIRTYLRMSNMQTAEIFYIFQLLYFSFFFFFLSFSSRLYENKIRAIFSAACKNNVYTSRRTIRNRCFRCVCLMVNKL